MSVQRYEAQFSTVGGGGEWKKEVRRGWDREEEWEEGGIGGKGDGEGKWDGEEGSAKEER